MLAHGKANPKNHLAKPMVKAMATSLVKAQGTSMVKAMATSLANPLAPVVLPPPVPLRDCDHARANIHWRSFKVFVNASPEVVDVGDLRGNAILKLGINAYSAAQREFPEKSDHVLHF